MSDSSRRLGEIAARFERGRLRDHLVTRWDGAGTGFPSLARIGVFAVAWLVVLGIVLPTAMPGAEELPVNSVDGTPDDLARSVTLDRRDERGFLTVERSEGLRVAWVGGSTLQEVAPDGGFRFIPGILAEQVVLEDGRGVDVDVYFLEAARVVDLYVATLQALDTRPDAIVVALNPALVYNGAAIQTWDNLDGLLVAHSLSDPSLVPLAAGLASPADVAWGLLGRHLPVVEGRWELGSSLNGRRTVGGLLAPDDSRADGPTDGLDRVAAMALPIDFWLADGDLSTGRSRLDRQVELFATAGEFDDRLNELVLSRLAHAVSDSGIPAVVYVPPIDTDAAASLGERLEEVVARLAGLEAAFAGRAVDFSPLPLPLDPAVLDHVDLLHVTNGVPVADEVGRRLCGVLLAEGVRCESGGGDR